MIEVRISLKFTVTLRRGGGGQRQLVKKDCFTAIQKKYEFKNMEKVFFPLKTGCNPMKDI